MRKNKKNFIEHFKKRLKETFSYLKEIKKYFLAAFLIFFLFVFVGYVFSENFSFLDKMLLKIIEETKGMSGIELFFFIFKNNLLICFFTILLGVLLSIFTMMVAIYNGILLGYVLRKLVISDRLLEIWRIFPHGIFELPAIFISLALGLKIGLFVFFRKKKERYFDVLTKSLNVFFFIVLPLLFIAAIIESILIIYL